MTTITTNPYALLSNSLINPQLSAQSNRTAVDGEAPAGYATTVTLSEEAKATLGAKSVETVISDAQKDIRALLSETGKTSPLENGELAVDLSGFDRRALFAMSSTTEGQFSVDEQKAASLELQRRFDTNLSGPAALVRISGDYRAIYDLAADYFDAAGAEEKASRLFQDQKTAIEEARAQLTANPDGVPSGIENDPVSDYLERAAIGNVSKERDFKAVANDIRAALDQHYIDTKTDGRALAFDGNQRAAKSFDFSRFGGRSLSAIALNSDNQFSNSEIKAAKLEMNARIGRSMQAAFSHSAKTNDPTAFSKNLIAQYQSFSSEEREAAGLTERYFDSLLSNYETSQKISDAFSRLSVLSGSSASNRVLSLLNYL